MLAAAIPLLASDGLEGTDQTTLTAAGLGGGGAVLLAGRARGMAGILVPLLVAGFFLGSTSRPATWLREQIQERTDVELPQLDLDAITSAIDPVSLLLIYAGAGLALAASFTGFIAKFTRRDEVR